MRLPFESLRKQDTFFVCFSFFREKNSDIKVPSYFRHKIENETHGAHVNFWYYIIITVFNVIFLEKKKKEKTKELER